MKTQAWSLNQAALEAIVYKAHNNQHPIRDVNPKDVEGLVASNRVITSRDQWAASWSSLAKKYESQAFEQIEIGQRKAGIEALQMAIRYYYIARWPLANSQGKKQAYQYLQSLFLRMGALQGNNFEVLTIPYKDSFIKAYLRRPDSAQAVPVVLHWGGIDTWKEDLNHLANAYLSKGWASIVVDMPGTGDAPELANISAESIFSTILDYIAGRAELDSKKVVAQGSSWGGYWATKLAVKEAARLKGAVNWGGPVHYFFAPEWQEKALASSEYLFDAKEAVMALYETDDFNIYLSENKKMSLVTQNVLSNKSAPMLYINGEKDSLVPFSETEVLNENIKNCNFWSNPKGVHMGVGDGINHQIIMAKVILPWISSRFEER